MTVRPALKSDMDDVVTLLHTHMNPRISRETWANLFTYDWMDDKPDYGRVAEANGKVVGFLGAVYSDRLIQGERVRIVNPNSWYLMKPERKQVSGLSAGLGLEMLTDLLSDKDRHYIANTSSKLTIRLLKRVGFQILDDSKYVWRREPHTEPASGIEVIEDPALMDGRITPDQQRIIEDHLDWPVAPILVKAGNDTLFMMVARAFKGDNEAWVDVMSCSNPDLLARHAQSIANIILKDDKGRFASDTRFCSHVSSGAQEVALDVARYHISNGIPLWCLDHIYSEVQLLNHKLS